MGKQSKRDRRRQREDARKQKLSEWRHEKKRDKEAFEAQARDNLEQAELHKKKHYPGLIKQIISGARITLPLNHPLYPFYCTRSQLESSLTPFTIRWLKHIVEHRPQLFSAPCGEFVGGVENSYGTALCRLAIHSRHALRTLEDWAPKGRNAHRNFQQLVEHLFAKYPTHPALYRELLNPHPNQDFTNLYFALAQGASLRKLNLPIPLTKKMCHLFPKAPPKLTLLQVFRWAQVTSMEASNSLRHAILHSDLGERLMADEDFWLTVMQWMTTHWDGHMHQVSPIIDYIRSMKEQDNAYSMKGRTASSMLRQMRAWHRMLGAARHITWAAIPASGLHGFERFDEEQQQGWQIQELRNSIELFQEGHQQGHCVYSYIGRASQGGTSIWSMTYTQYKKTKRALTIEVNNQARAIVQVRGKSNRDARPEERKLIRGWAKENNLQERYF